MPKRFSACAALLALVLATPALAGGETAVVHPTARIDISALTVESDFTVFMHKDVPEEVQRTALRRLWTLMQLPVSCDDLCSTQHPEADLFASHELRAAVAAR